MRMRENISTAGASNTCVGQMDVTDGCLQRESQVRMKVYIGDVVCTRSYTGYVMFGRTSTLETLTCMLERSIRDECAFIHGNDE